MRLARMARLVRVALPVPFALAAGSVSLRRRRADWRESDIAERMASDPQIWRL